MLGYSISESLRGSLSLGGVVDALMKSVQTVIAR
jgi:hypothetical protein